MKLPWPPPYTYGLLAIWSAAAIMRAITPLEPEDEPLESEPELELEWRSWSGVEGALMPRASAVAGPTTPSAVSPCALWKCFTACSVWGPKTPSAGMPSACCTSDTELEPDEPVPESLECAWA